MTVRDVIGLGFLVGLLALAPRGVSAGDRDAAAPDAPDAGPAPAGANPARSADGRVYLPAGSQLDYAVALAPLPTGQLGPIAVDSLERVAGQQGDPAALVVGAVPPGTPPSGWPREVGAGARTGTAPLGAAAADHECDCATRVADTADQRVAAIYASRSFRVGPEVADLAGLRLRMRYHDGVVVYLNGREVARRNLDPDATPMAPARRPHGPEWEIFYLTLPPGLLGAGDNTLAVEVRPSGYRLAPDLDLELVAAPSSRAEIVRGPMVQRVGPTSAVIRFDTDLPAFGVVEYGPTGERGQVARSAGGGLAVHHEVELTGLPADHAIHYRVVAGASASAPLTFHTAPPPGAVIRFAVYGDVRGGHRVHHEIVEAMLRDAPDFALHTGDLVLRGSDEGDWQRFFAVAADLLARVPLYPVLGNHDMGRSGAEGLRLRDVFALPPGPPDAPVWAHWYSFDVADLHFVMLDSNSYDYPGQLEWLEADLAGARAAGAGAIFAVTHDGPYGRALHGGNRYAAQHYVPVLARYGVTLLFSGHEHYYQRGRAGGLNYIVTGGGGAPLYRARCGVPGKRRCKVADGMRYQASEHHYVMVTVSRKQVVACAKRPDGSPLDKCATYRLRRPRVTPK